MDSFSSLGSQLDMDLSYSLNSLWIPWVPRNIQLLGWRLIFSRLQTSDELAKRVILFCMHNLVYPFFLGPAEYHVHLFLICPINYRVWLIMLDWINIGPLFTCVGLLSHLMAFEIPLERKIKKIWFLLFWLFVVWFIWLIKIGSLFKWGINEWLK